MNTRTSLLLILVLGVALGALLALLIDILSNSARGEWVVAGGALCVAIGLGLDT